MQRRVVERKPTDVSEAYIISKFRVEEQAKKETSYACCLLQAEFLLGLLFDPEDGDHMSLQNVVDFHRTTRHYISEDRTLNSHHCENIKSNKKCTNLISGSKEHISTERSTSWKLRIYQADNTTLSKNIFKVFTKEIRFKSYKNKAGQGQNNKTKNHKKRGETHERRNKELKKEEKFVSQNRLSLSAVMGAKGGAVMTMNGIRSRKCFRANGTESFRSSRTRHDVT
jgi:hypothetical protein